MPNVNVDANDATRVASMWELISDAVDDIQSQSSADVKDNVKRFLLHVAWHEGRFLRTRVQDPKNNGATPGPGRSFFQLEPPRAKDAVDYAKQREPDRHWLTLLATRSGLSKQELETASIELLLSATTWPANSKIETCLRESDLFGVYMTRMALARLPAVIPPGNREHATYWADNWKKIFKSPEERELLIARFIEECKMVDALVP